MNERGRRDKGGRRVHEDLLSARGGEKDERKEYDVSE
jgi:hypothetical protein